MNRTNTAPPKTGARWLSATAMVVILAIVVTVKLTLMHLNVLSLLGLGMTAILIMKLALSLWYRPSQGPVDPGTVTVILPVFNEDPATLRACLLSLLNQTHSPQRVHVIDDASNAPDAVNAALTMVDDFAAKGIELVVDTQPTNQGKRAALGRAINESPDATWYFGVDSDTILDERALSECLRAGADERVHAVTGLVLAANHRTNLLTRLTDLRYGNAFSYERAAYSVARGSTLCACGSLALYRGRVLRANLDDFLGQEFLGKPAVFGDDRRITNYALMDGRSVYQETAVAYTAVPERFGHYLRQQTRWSKSFFRESVWVMRNMSPRRIAWWLTLVELSSWFVYTGFLLASLAMLPFDGRVHNIATYGFFLVMLSYARSARYLDLARTGTSGLERLGVFALAPIYALMHLFVMVPLRVWALVTLRTGKWGTREQVEVALAT